MADGYSSSGVVYFTVNNMHDIHILHTKFAKSTQTKLPSILNFKNTTISPSKMQISESIVGTKFIFDIFETDVTFIHRAVEFASVSKLNLQNFTQLNTVSNLGKKLVNTRLNIIARFVAKRNTNNKDFFEQIQLVSLINSHFMTMLIFDPVAIEMVLQEGNILLLYNVILRHDINCLGDKQSNKYVVEFDKHSFLLQRFNNELKNALTAQYVTRKVSLIISEVNNGM